MKDTEKIEITEEMIEAGRRVLFIYDPEYDSEIEIVRKIYLAMEEERLRGLPSVPCKK